MAIGGGIKINNITVRGGADGKTPVFKIENGHLYNKYDNTAKWQDLGEVKGEKGDSLDPSAYATTKDVADAIAELNIKNGAGENSLVQKDTDGNYSGGNGSTTLGNGNQNNGDRSLVAGGDNSNTYTGIDSIVSGCWNSNSGARSIVSGYGNSNKYNDHFMLGSNLKNSDNLNEQEIDKLVTGKYNNPQPSTVYEIGNGLPTERSNAFEVYEDGSVRAGRQTTYSDNYLTLTTVRYVNLCRVFRVYPKDVITDPKTGILIPKLTSAEFSSLYYGAGTADNITVISSNSMRIYIVYCNLIVENGVNYRNIVGFLDNYKIKYTRNESTSEITYSVSKMVDEDELEEQKTYIMTSDTNYPYLPTDITDLQEAAEAIKAGRLVYLNRTGAAGYNPLVDSIVGLSYVCLTFFADNKLVYGIQTSDSNGEWSSASWYEKPMQPIYYRHEITITGLGGNSNNQVVFDIDNTTASAYTNISFMLSSVAAGQAVCLMKFVATSESGSTTSWFNGMVKYNSSFLTAYGNNAGSNIVFSLMSSSVGNATITDTVTKL